MTMYNCKGQKDFITIIICHNFFHLERYRLKSYSSTFMNRVDLFTFKFSFLYHFSNSISIISKMSILSKNWVIVKKLYNNCRDLLHNFRSYLYIYYAFRKKKECAVRCDWRIYSSIGIPNLFTCITSTILFGLTSYTPEFSQILYSVVRYCSPIYFDIKFLAEDFPQRSCYRNDATVLSHSNLDCLKPLT